MHVSFAIPRHRSSSTSTGLRESSHALRFECSRRTPSVVAVNVHGDVDASNADELTRYLARVRGPRDDVILDLSGVTFFGTHGLSVLMRPVSGGAVVVPSPVVDRLLRLCDPESRVPVAADVDAAMAMLRRRPRPALWFLTDLPSRL
jgi:anti-anti-sigma factor